MHAKDKTPCGQEPQCCQASSLKEQPIGSLASGVGRSGNNLRHDQQPAIHQVDVPADGSCLFWAVTLAYLIPVKDNDAIFEQRYKALFGNEGTESASLSNVRKLIQNYNPLSDDVPDNNKLGGLIREKFRNRVVDHMRSHENDFIDFIEARGSFEHYLQDMRNPNTWGGEPEIKAMSEMLSVSINVSSTAESQYENGSTRILLFHTNSSKTDGTRNHYNFGLEQSIINNYRKKTNVGTLKHQGPLMPKQENQQSISDNNRQSEPLNQISPDLGAQSLSRPQQVNKELNEDEKIINNGGLFHAMRQNITCEEKSREIQKYLSKGADVNAKDANDSNNTPLHMAVRKDEPEIVILLLDNGAIISNKNDKGQTPLHIAELSDKPNGQEIINILESHLKSLSQPSNQQVSVEQSSLVINSVEQSQSSEQSSVQQQPQRQGTRDASKRNEQQMFSSNNKKQKQSQLSYSKRSGTSGITGQLYETKLSTLILLRALNDKKINEFYLATNVDGIGAIDDIVFRYILNGKKKVKFIQAKHRDNPDKGRVTVSEVQKNEKGNDFSLYKYLESYLRIKQKFNPKSNDALFEGNFRYIDCDFVIYTPAKENFIKKKKVELNTSKDDLLYTSETGKTFQFQYEDDDINRLMKTASESRAELLAKSLAKLILKNEHNAMSDELIKSYHVFLAQKVIEVSDIDKGTGDHRKGKFRPEFFDSNEGLLSILRKTLYKGTVVTCGKELKLQPKEIKNLVDEILKNPSADSISKLIGSKLTFDAEKKRLQFIDKKIPQEIIQLKDGLGKMEVMQETINEAFEIAAKEKLKFHSFKLPSTFGNLDFKVKGKKRLEHLVSIFTELLTSATSDNIVKIDDNMVGEGKTLKNGDIEINGGIGGLVGNLLILDEETMMLKFNDGELLPKNAKLLFKTLKDKISESENLRDKDLSSYKFEINVNGFPRLSFIDEKYDKNLIKEFLGKLWFYTDQAKEDEVGKIVTEILYQNHKADKKQNEFTFRIKSHAMFLKVHDELQNWWKQEKADYLTKSCKFFDQAEKDVVDSPLLTILNFIYVNKFNNKNITFNQGAIQTLELENFTARPNERILNIITDESIISSVKLDQYFENKNSNHHTFMDLDYVSGTGCYKQAISEFEQGKPDILIIGCNYAAGKRNEEELYRELKGIMDNNPKSSKKIILVTEKNNILAENFKKDFPDKHIEKRDKKNNLINLTPESQTNLLENSKVIFQGQEISLNKLIVEESKHLIDIEVLSKLINNEIIELGKIHTNSRDELVKDYYIDRTFIRHIGIHPSAVSEDHIRYNEDYYKLLKICTQFGYKDLIKKDSKFFVIDKYQNTKSNRQQKQDIVLISDNEEDFKKLCDKYKKRSIHWLKHGYYGLIWQKSHGNLSNLYKFAITTTNDQNTKEYKPKRITDIPDRIVIIAAEPGMGKTTVLTPLALKTKESDPSSLWVVRINLLEQSSQLNKWLEDKTEIDESQAVRFLYGAMDFLVFTENVNQTTEEKEQMINNILELIKDNSEKSLKNNDESKIKGRNLLEVRLFYQYYKQGKIALLFDGFDEISPDYKDQVIQLLEVLNGTKAEKIWLTTRSYNIQGDIENALGTFSYALRPFVKVEQRDFLKKFWKKKLDLKELDEKRSEVFIGELLGRFSKTINDQGGGFVGIPLLISMIAEVFQDTFKDFYVSKSQELSEKHKKKLSEMLNLATLYKYFIETKFHKIRFGEKNPGLSTHNPGIKDVLNSEYKISIENHRNLALFEDNRLSNLLSEKETNELNSKIKAIQQKEQRTGIIKIINGKPNFIHRTFAEYFVSSYFWEKFKSIKFDKFGEDFIESIIINNLIEDDRIQICKFFQSEAKEDLEKNVSISDKEDKLKTLLTTLVNNINRYGPSEKKNSKQSTKLLLKIIEFSLPATEGSDLGIIRDVVQGINDDKILELLSVSAEMGYKILTDALITVALDHLSTQFLKNCLKQDEWVFSPVWLAAKNRHRDVVQILVDKLYYDLTWTDKEGKSLLKRVLEYEKWDVLWSCLKFINASRAIEMDGEEKLLLCECIQRDAPLDVIELLMEQIDIDFVNQFKIGGTPAVFQVIKHLIRYDKNVVNLLLEKGINFNAGYDDGCPINVLTARFKNSISKSIPHIFSPTKRNIDIKYKIFSDNDFSKFFDILKILLENGAIYNLKDDYGNTPLKDVKQMYHIQKMFKAVLETADAEKDTVRNLLDKISDKLIPLILKSTDVKCSNDFKGYVDLKHLRPKNKSEITFLSIGELAESLLKRQGSETKGEKSYYNSKEESCYEEDQIEGIFFVPEYIQILFSCAYEYVGTESTVIKGALDVLSHHVDVLEGKKPLSAFTSCKYEFDNMVPVIKENDTMNSNPLGMLLSFRVMEISSCTNRTMKEAFNEVSEAVLQLNEKAQLRLKNLKKTGENEPQRRVNKSDEILNTLGIEDLLSEINKSNGIGFLHDVLRKLNGMGKEGEKEALKSIVKCSEQSSQTFELLKTIDDLFDAVNTNNSVKVDSLLQGAIKSSFIKAVLNVQNKKRQTLLHLAIEHNNVEITSLLRRYGDKFL